MAITKGQLLAKARGFVVAFRAMTAKQREQSPCHAVIDDYNKLRLLVEKTLPDLKDLLPPALLHEIVSWNGSCKYQDIHAFTEQIANLLDAVQE